MEGEAAAPRFLGFGGDNGEDMERAVKGSALSTVYSQPMTVCRALMQFGYNPLPLSTPFGSRYPFSSGVFSYMFYISGAHGFPALWTGLEVAVVRATIASAVRQYLFRFLEDFLPNLGGASEIVKNSPRSVWQRCRVCVRGIIRNLLIVIPLDICVYPFQLILSRKIAELVIGPIGYHGIFDSASLIFEEEGLKGFFTGFYPFLLSSLLEVLITSSVMLGVDVFFYHFLKHYSKYDEHNILRDLGGAVFKAMISFVTYPYTLSSTLCSVARCGTLTQNSKSNFKLSCCADWRQIKTTLNKNKVQYRGRSLFLRPYHGPVVYGIDGRLYEARV